MKKQTIRTPEIPARMKICFERILPEELDTERSARRAIRNFMAESLGRTLNPQEIGHHTRMALVNTKKWDSGTTLRCRFLDGTPKVKKAVEAVAHQWEQYANIKFKFVTTGNAEIRISFCADDGSWSAVGRDALNRSYFPLHQPTMNYGWLDDSSSAAEIKRVVLHEFGHALGCIHEHQGPNFTRKWDTAKVIAAFQGPPNYWSPEDITSNVLQKYSPKGISTTVYDPKSIMLYFFDANLFADGGGPTNENNGVSPLDRQMIRKLYP